MAGVPSPYMNLPEGNRAGAGWAATGHHLLARRTGKGLRCAQSSDRAWIPHRPSAADRSRFAGAASKRRMADMDAEHRAGECVAASVAGWVKQALASLRAFDAGHHDREYGEHD